MVPLSPLPGRERVRVRVEVLKPGHESITISVQLEPVGAA
jgi:hypothetical protein